MSEQEQFEFRALIRDGLARVAPVETTRVLVARGCRGDEELRGRLVELGLPGLVVADEHGGAGAGPQALGILLEEAGRALLPTAYFSSATVVPFLLDRDRSGHAGEVLAALAAGTARVTFADVDERGAQPAVLADGPDGPTLTGAKTAVIDGDLATTALVTATRADGSVVVAVDVSSPGVVIEHLRCLDETRPVVHMRFDGAAAVPLDIIDVDRVLHDARALQRLALAAEAAGQIAACLDLSVDYAKSRKQFGRAIGGFQAIKHRCADMFVAAQASSASVAAAFIAWDEHPDQRGLIAEAAASYCLQAGFDVAASTMQIHGGIAFTAEGLPQLYLKRAKAAQLLAGGIDTEVARLAEEIFAPGRDPLAPILGAAS
ncbi:acyl-CoA dehydrogenase family protein [Gordonia alkanivorans]|uniref:acyl-CoA dehydrogenase family protein n=1 Tax=Gordonia alkanivorans TaxID=84096 RepID=UPI0024473736|nr:acyl-CoA dehydrogenase family protein [Gordonia alkanivorans]MDH3047232.1 acyl-CoA/acyl-ACP dehydrogenase [Gordonia alkanivorans]